MFRNHEAEALQKQLDWLQTQYDAREKIHAEELKRAITEIETLRTEYQRLIVATHPVVANVVLPKERIENANDAPPPAPQQPVGTPWQRVQAAWVKQLEEEAKTPMQKQAELATAAVKPA